jgi:hypothetical protein
MCESPCYVVAHDDEENHIVPSLCMFSGVHLLLLCYLCGHKEAYEYVAVSKGSKY